MNTLIADFRALQMSQSAPVGYVLEGGVVVVWNGTRQNNYATEEFARQAYPNLTIIATGVMA